MHMPVAGADAHGTATQPDSHASATLGRFRLAARGGDVADLKLINYHHMFDEGMPCLAGRDMLERANENRAATITRRD